MDTRIGRQRTHEAASQPLAGGNGAPVVLQGGSVRRVAGEWTPAVHSLLNALEAAAIEGVPRARGFDELGREVVTFVPGEMMSDSHPEILWSESILIAAALLLRRIHDASRALVAEGGHVWRSPRTEPAEVICHNDFAPYNFVVRDGALVGAIDFDYAAPGPRIWDVAYLAYRLVPLAEDASGADSLSRHVRLRTLIETYGLDATPAQVRSVIVSRLEALAVFTRERARDTGRSDFLAHASMYERDAQRLRFCESP